ncbi:hypothetical protein ACFCVO_15905 [Agromyces sp. NPDC056379]|uniref:hypothetical protein n=1 Tax=unclassified Agromyces TaxID=2639701 RepID=UPI0035DA2DDB
MSASKKTIRDRTPSKTGFAFEPRSLCMVPTVFGRTSALFVSVDGFNVGDPRLRAAQLQHRVANAVREEILARGQTLEEHLAEIDANVPGLSYDRMVRLLRGKTQMQLADVLFWADQFDRVRAVAVEDFLHGFGE